MGLLEVGATLLSEEPWWTVLADPEGNEVCVIADPGAAHRARREAANLPPTRAT